MSFLGAAIGGLIGGVNKDAPKINYTPTSFSGGGLNATFGGNSYSVGADPNRANAVGNIANTFGAQANDIGGLRGQWGVGSSNLRQAQLASLQSSQTAGIGNLRDNLAQRRVLGSSFGQDQITRANMEYENQRQNVIAQTYMQELQAQQQLIQQQYTAARGQFQTGLDEMNLEAGIAADLTGKASTTLANVATTQAQLDMWNQANQSKFWAGVGGNAGQQLGQVASMFI